MKPMRSIAAAVILAALFAACGSSSGDLGTLPPASPSAAPSLGSEAPDVTPGTSPSPSAVPSGSPQVTSSPSGETKIVRAYFILGGGAGTEGLVPYLFEVPATQAVATAAIKALLDSSTIDADTRADLSSAIPAGTKLLGLKIDNGIATIDLSSEFESGGGSASTLYRLGQVVYTLTQFSTVKSVVFQVEGQTVTVFGSEGIVLDGPVSRKTYIDLLPAIFVDRPAFGAALGNPGRITGNANVFEATFRISILSGSGAVLADKQVMATCGTGCRGTFDVTIAYQVDKAQWGTLRAYEPSAKDGSPVNVREYPVWLAPAS